MVYVSILNQKEVGKSDGYLDLRVIRDSGVKVDPDVNINITDLNVSGNKKFKHFFNNGNGGVTFKVEIIIMKTDKIGDTFVTDYIQNLIENMLPVSVVSDAIDIPKDPAMSTYLITDNSERKQSYDDSTVWSLEFTTYTPLNIYKYQNDNTAVLNALKKSKNKKSKKSTKKASTINTKLKNCDYKKLVYSKNKKVVTCVKYLQQVLKKQKVYSGKIDGWFGKDTKNSVKQYQKNYNKKYKVVNQINTSNSGIIVTAGKLISGESLKITPVNSKPKISKRLSVTGKVDKATWTALYKGE